MDISVTPPAEVETQRSIPIPKNRSNKSPQINQAEAAWGKRNIGDFLDLTRDSDDAFEEGSEESSSNSDSEAELVSELISASNSESRSKSEAIYVASSGSEDEETIGTERKCERKPAGQAAAGAAGAAGARAGARAGGGAGAASVTLARETSTNLIGGEREWQQQGMEGH